jgi:Polysaccharide lyase
MVPTLISVLGSVVVLGCSSAVSDESRGCGPEGLLESFVTPDGFEVFIYEDGTARTDDGGTCTVILQYFDPDFLQKHYLTNESGTFLVIEGGGLFPTKNDFVDDFEGYGDFTDMFVRSPADTDRYWSSFTLLSPQAPTIAEYVELRSCILDGSCSFRDNRIGIVEDPADATNRVLRFTSVPPSPGMITAKSSISSELSFFIQGSDVWFQADYYIESGMPFSLVDLENDYFLEGPGPRVVIRGDALAIENKFGSKINYLQSNPVPVPLGRWFSVKVHLRYSHGTDGLIELWQDGEQLISARGINLPTVNSVQNSVEVGVTATSIGSVLLLDNMRISGTPF